jgi:DNA mismatch endonuclease (patch repair protein)
MARYDGDRRALMARFRSKDTKPEIITRKILHALGYRFRLHRKDLPGKPDIVLPKHRAVIFVHGCFWHRHHGCRTSVVPKTNPEFWQNKFDYNTTRDALAQEKLRGAGWRVLVVWECETKCKDALATKLKEFLMCETTAHGRRTTVCSPISTTVRQSSDG